MTLIPIAPLFSLFFQLRMILLQILLGPVEKTILPVCPQNCLLLAFVLRLAWDTFPDRAIPFGLFISTIDLPLYTIHI